jgi:hypothetical protein
MKKPEDNKPRRVYSPSSKVVMTPTRVKLLSSKWGQDLKKPREDVDASNKENVKKNINDGK